MDGEKERFRTLKNGAVYDMERKRIVANPGGGTAAITKETASDMADLRRKRKQETLLAAANAAVERADYRTKYGDMAFVAAIGDAAMLKATTPDDPKAIDAARFLLQETALTEPKQAAPVAPQLNVLVVDDSLRKLVDRLAAGAQVIDADATEADEEEK